MVESRRSACSALSSRFCGVELATRTIVQSIALNNTRALLPPLKAPALPPREAHQGKLGYENHPMYDYLARSQARNWHLASRRGRAPVVQQDTLGLAPALRSQGEGVGKTFFYKNLLRLTRRRYLIRNLLRPQGYREELVKALPRELVKAPLQGPIWYPVHPGDSEEGLNRRGARDLVDSDATATRRLNEVEIWAKL